MKHHLTGAFVLAAMAAPLAAQAEGKIYGQFNISISEIDGAIATVDGDNFAPTSQTQDGQSGDNNASRLGFQGENGQFFYAVELGLDVDVNGGDSSDSADGLAHTRHAFVGFNSSVGTFTFGRTNTAYKLAAQRLDPFYDTSAVNFLGIASNQGGGYGLSNLANGWTNNSIAYISPEFAGLTFNAGVYLQEMSDESHDYGVGVDYRLGDLSLGVQYLTIGADSDVTDPNAAAGVVSGSGKVVDTALQGTVSYNTERFSVGFSAEQVELRGSNEDRIYMFLAGEFALNEHLTLAASVGDVDQGAGEGMGFTVGAYLDLIEDFTLYGLYSQSDLDNDPSSETDVISVGIRYGFEI